MDFIGPHADNEKSILKDRPILSFSFGQERPFHIHYHGKVYKTILLENNSLVVMGEEMQQHYKHSVPKVSARQYQGKRINITFRMHAK